MASTILIVDDEPKICLTLSEILSKRGYGTLRCTDPDEVIPTLRSNRVDLLLIDVKMPGKDGIELLRSIRAQMGDLDVIMISGHATVDQVVVAMKYGALNFYTKPIDNQKLMEEIGQLAQAQGAREGRGSDAQIVTNHPAMLRVLDLAGRAAPTDATVTITGESGTGKELIAELLHGQSGRSAGPFVKVNCAAIPEPLLESEMFGHEKGAFTDAAAQKQGQFERARTGSIFLDEIGDMSPNLQPKMLRVLQDRSFTRVGGQTELKTDCRVIAATNRDPRDLVARGLLREDLYYRLSVITLHLPPLRERGDDVLLLAEHFLQAFNQRYGKRIGCICPEVRSLLLAHEWPGNVRELRNFMERSVIFCEGERIEPTAIPDPYRTLVETAATPLDVRYQTSAKDVIVEALQKTRGVKQKAAELLNIDRKTLYRKIKKYRIGP